MASDHLGVDTSTGLSVIIGSWNTIAMRLPAQDRAAAPRMPMSWPSSSTEPPAMRPGGSISPRMEYPVTLLPEPDSPTRPRISAGVPRRKRHAVDRAGHAPTGGARKFGAQAARAPAGQRGVHRLAPRVELVAHLVADQVDRDDQ
jgi:hypothetical protein